MNYRRISRYRGYPYIKPNPYTVQGKANEVGPTEKDTEKSEVEKIPLPNENPIPSQPGTVRSNRPMFLSNFFRNIHADDIILLGLILILIQENLEDEFLIIVLLYLLIAGRDY